MDKTNIDITMHDLDYIDQINDETNQNSKNSVDDSDDDRLFSEETEYSMDIVKDGNGRLKFGIFVSKPDTEEYTWYIYDRITYQLSDIISDDDFDEMYAQKDYDNIRLTNIFNYLSDKTAKLVRDGVKVMPDKKESNNIIDAEIFQKIDVDYMFEKLCKTLSKKYTGKLVDINNSDTDWPEIYMKVDEFYVAKSGYTGIPNIYVSGEQVKFFNVDKKGESYVELKHDVQEQFCLDYADELLFLFHQDTRNWIDKVNHPLTVVDTELAKKKVENFKKKMEEMLQFVDERMMDMARKETRS